MKEMAQQQKWQRCERYIIYIITSHHEGDFEKLKVTFVSDVFHGNHRLTVSFVNEVGPTIRLDHREVD